MVSTELNCCVCRIYSVFGPIWTLDANTIYIWIKWTHARKCTRSTHNNPRAHYFHNESSNSGVSVSSLVIPKHLGLHVLHSDWSSIPNLLTHYWMYQSWNWYQYRCRTAFIGWQRLLNLLPNILEKQNKQRWLQRFILYTVVLSDKLSVPVAS